MSPAGAMIASSTLAGSLGQNYFGMQGIPNSKPTKSNILGKERKHAPYHLGHPRAYQNCSQARVELQKTFFMPIPARMGTSITHPRVWHLKTRRSQICIPILLQNIVTCLASPQPLQAGQPSRSTSSRRRTLALFLAGDIASFPRVLLLHWKFENVAFASARVP